MTDFSKRLHQLPLHARGAVEETTKYFVHQALPEVSADTSATELTAVLTKIRHSIECAVLLDELPASDRQQILNLPDLAATLAHSRIRRGDIELNRSDLPDHECFQRRDRVWVPSETGHSLRGYTATFRSYTDPRIGHVQRQARIRLEGDEGDALLPPECLTFAPDREVLRDSSRCHESERLEAQRHWRELHLAGRTKEAILAVAKYGTVEDLCEVLDLDVFEAYDVVVPLAWEDERLRMFGWEVLRVRNWELGAG